MSTYIDLYSYWRDAVAYPNPADYIVTADNVSTWNKEPRKVLANSNRPSGKVIEFVEGVQVLECRLPYGNVTYVDASGATITVNTGDLQRIYLDVHNPYNNDLQLIYSINNKMTNARFVLMFDGFQNSTSTTNPIWVKFKCEMHQAMRFTRNDSIIVRIMQEEGYVLTITDTSPPTKANQTYILLEVTPFLIDGYWDNNGLSSTTLL